MKRLATLNPVRSRALGICAVAGLSLALVGCGSSASTAATGTAASSEAAQSAQAAASTEATAADYVVTIDGSRMAQDYKGKSVLVVSYSFTNNSDSAQSFASAVIAKAFQNGVQIQDSFGVDGVDTNGYMAEVKPGGTSKVELAYQLTDQSDVTVEVKELISFGDTKLAEATFSVA